MRTDSVEENQEGLCEFFFARHGARLDQKDFAWRQTSPTPYDTPITAFGVLQANLIGQAVYQHSASTRIVIHTSPFLRCVQTSLALASSLYALNGGRRITLRIDCALGEWMTPDYFEDIQAPPPMPELASHARHFLAHEDGFVDVDWSWDSTLLGEGGEYGEEWPEMHTRIRHYLKSFLAYYAGKSFMSNVSFLDPSVRSDCKPSGKPLTNGSNPSRTLMNDTNPSKKPLTDKPRLPGKSSTIPILVSHGAGCNAMISAVTGRPVLTDVELASLSHAVRKPFQHGNKISDQYCLLMSASTQHLPVPQKQADRQSWQVHRSASLSRQNPAKEGLWTNASARRSLVPPAHREDQSAPRQPPNVKQRQRSFSVQT